MLVRRIWVSPRVSNPMPDWVFLIAIPVAVVVGGFLVSWSRRGRWRR